MLRRTIDAAPQRGDAGGQRGGLGCGVILIDRVRQPFAAPREIRPPGGMNKERSVSINKNDRIQPQTQL